VRVVVISHGHPDFARGGGEIAAYNLFKGLAAVPGHEAWFLARVPMPLLHPGTYLALHREREYLFAGEAEVQELTATVDLAPDAEFAALLKRLQPDVIHFHHYYKVGIELIRVARKACPRARLIMTLHEYMAICANHGTMVKTDMTMCYRASPRDCQQCSSHKGGDWYFLRERYIKSFFALIDVFISPSQFLAQRYVEWGIPQQKMHVIENGIEPGAKLPPRLIKKGEGHTRFAFFGQMHPYKGLDVILDAFGGLPEPIRRQVALDIHGSGLELMAGPYPVKLKKLLKKHSSLAHYHGPYEQSELPRLMRETDWVIMGSIWWENSPVVIQEAYKFGRPVICPDLGGMAEKVEHGTGGLHFRARDPLSLRKLVESIATDSAPVPYDTLIARLPDHASVTDSVDAHLTAYRAAPARAMNRREA
jgi:glycosyltransferase involved in cell wall biosynthesis